VRYDIVLSETFRNFYLNLLDSSFSHFLKKNLQMLDTLVCYLNSVCTYTDEGSNCLLAIHSVL